MCAGKGLAQGTNVGWLLRLDLHDDAALEVDAQLQPGIDEQADGQRRQQERAGQAVEPRTHEVHAGIVGDETEQGAHEHG